MLQELNSGILFSSLITTVQVRKEAEIGSLYMSSIPDGWKKPNVVSLGSISWTRRQSMVEG